MSLYALVLAGGSGKRLWPLSRRTQPKQLLALPGPNTLLQTTLERLSGVVCPEHILVLTREEHMAIVRSQTPTLAPEQVIGEPEPFGTAPAAALGAAIVRARDPNATMVLLPADHIIHPVTAFQQALLSAVEVAAAGYLVTFGIRPNRVETGYGYIARGRRLRTQTEAYRVAKFIEKPDRGRAERFVASGRHYWNSGMFAWNVETFSQVVTQLLPSLGTFMTALTEKLAQGQTLGSESFRHTLHALWSKIEERTTIDYGIMERCDCAACLPVQFDWSDLGSWASVAELYPVDETGSAARGDHLTLDSCRCLIQSLGGRLVAAIGVSDLVIVDTPDALLVCHRDHAQKVKELVDRLEAEGRNELL